MPHPAEGRPELTPEELALLLEMNEIRGYTPRDQIAEPDHAPPGPASASGREPAGPVDEAESPASE